MRSFLECIYETLDWTSIKLTGASLATSVASINIGEIQLGFFKINVSALTGWLTIGVMISTIAYNALRFYKEWKEIKTNKNK